MSKVCLPKDVCEIILEYVPYYELVDWIDSDKIEWFSKNISGYIPYEYFLRSIPSEYIGFNRRAGDILVDKYFEMIRSGKKHKDIPLDYIGGSNKAYLLYEITSGRDGKINVDGFDGFDDGEIDGEEKFILDNIYSLDEINDVTAKIILKNYDTLIIDNDHEDSYNLFNTNNKKLIERVYNDYLNGNITINWSKIYSSNYNEIINKIICYEYYHNEGKNINWNSLCYIEEMEDIIFDEYYNNGGKNINWSNVTYNESEKVMRIVIEEYKKRKYCDKDDDKKEDRSREKKNVCSVDDNSDEKEDRGGDGDDDGDDEKECKDGDDEKEDRSGDICLDNLYQNINDIDDENIVDFLVDECLNSCKDSYIISEMMSFNHDRVADYVIRNYTGDPGERKRAEICLAQQLDSIRYGYENKNENRKVVINWNHVYDNKHPKIHKHLYNLLVENGGNDICYDYYKVDDENIINYIKKKYYETGEINWVYISSRLSCKAYNSIIINDYYYNEGRNLDWRTICNNEDDDIVDILVHEHKRNNGNRLHYYELLKNKNRRVVSDILRDVADAKWNMGFKRKLVNKGDDENENDDSVEKNDSDEVGDDDESSDESDKNSRCESDDENINWNCLLGHSGIFECRIDDIHDILMSL